ncbi:MAG: hypothetical protein ABW061_26480 [Polyangiaceae bacterium]
MTRRSNTSGASVHLTFANGEAEKVHLVHVPIGSVPSGGPDEAYKIAQFEYRADLSFTARVGLLLQNAGDTTAEDVTVAITVPDTLEMTFAERQPPPKVASKAPAAGPEPSPRSWRADTATRAHCRVVRVASSVGLPPLFLLLKDRTTLGDFPLEVSITTARPAAEHTERLLVQFVHAPV